MPLFCKIRSTYIKFFYTKLHGGFLLCSFFFFQRCLLLLLHEWSSRYAKQDYEMPLIYQIHEFFMSQLHFFKDPMKYLCHFSKLIFKHTTTSQFNENIVTVNRFDTIRISRNIRMMAMKSNWSEILKKKNSSAFLYKKDFSDFGGIKFSSFGNALQKHLFRTKFVHSEIQMV